MLSLIIHPLFLWTPVSPTSRPFSQVWDSGSSISCLLFQQFIQSIPLAAVTSCSRLSPLWLSFSCLLGFHFGSKILKRELDVSLWELYASSPNSSKGNLDLTFRPQYLFGIVYSPGEGPVPFTYSAEAYPL